MRIYTNEPLIQRRAKLGQYSSWGGLAILAAGFVINLRVRPDTPNSFIWVLVSLVCLVAGFALANIGGYNMRRFARSPRPDEKLSKALSGFDDRYVQFSWMLPASNIVAGPSGVYAFALRDQAGKISNIGDRWRQPFSPLRFLTAFGQEGLGNPSLDAQQDARKMERYLAEHAPELEVAVQPMVIFLNPQTELSLSNPAVPVVDPKGLKSLLRQRAKGGQLKPATLEQLEALFTSTPK